MIAQCARCNGLCAWPPGAKLNAAPPAGARLREWRCGACNGRLRAYAPGTPDYGRCAQSVPRQLEFTFATPPVSAVPRTSVPQPL